MPFFGVLPAAGAGCGPEAFYHKFTRATLSLVDKQVVQLPVALKLAESSMPFNPLEGAMQAIPLLTGEAWARIQGELRAGLKGRGVNLAFAREAEKNTASVLDVRLEGEGSLNREAVSHAIADGSEIYLALFEDVLADNQVTSIGKRLVVRKGNSATKIFAKEVDAWAIFKFRREFDGHITVNRYAELPGNLYQRFAGAQLTTYSLFNKVRP